jgi:predicted PurR-regulated permease PerM
LIVISLFFAMGLNPAVLFLERRGLSRAKAVASTVSLVVAFVGVFIWVAAPLIIDQVNALINNAPQMISDLKSNATINELNANYGIVDTIQNKVQSSIKDGKFVIGAFGGVIGVGKAVISGALSMLTILVLTLYFLAALPTVTKDAYRLVPASRRERVAKISDAIIFRVGAFVGGQLTISFFASIFILILGFSLDLPYKGALALVVFVCGLIPLIGHFIGMTIVTLIALTVSPLIAVIALASYIIYVQFENYVLTPRVMKRSLSIPGLVTIIAALIGTSLLGLVGGILAVPIAAAVLLAGPLYVRISGRKRIQTVSWCLAAQLALYIPLAPQPVFTATYGQEVPAGQTVLTPRDADLEIGRLLVEEIGGAPGPVLADDIGYVLSAKRQIQLQPFQYGWLVRRGKLDPVSLLRKIREGYFSIIIIRMPRADGTGGSDFPEPVIRTVEENCSLTREIGPYRIYGNP